MSDIGGVWRTVGGRRIFIKDGKDLATAMIESGKFNVEKGLSANQKSTVENHKKPLKLETIDISNSNIIIKTLEKYENIIKNDKIENAIVITSDGEVYQCFGNKSNVWPNRDLGDKLKKAYVTHNHIKTETNYSFSQDDIDIFKKYELSALRGIDNRYTYELDRNGKSSLKQPNWNDNINDCSYEHLKSIDYAANHNISYKRWKNE